MIRKLLVVFVAIFALACGSDSETTVQNDPPIGTLSHASIVKRGAIVKFDASRSTDPTPGETLRYTFVFGDGTPSVTSANPSAEHTYDVNGTFQVSVTVEDSVGNRTQVLGELNVVDNIEAFSCPDVACEVGSCLAGECIVDNCTDASVCPLDFACDDGICQPKSGSETPDP